MAEIKYSNKLHALAGISKYMTKDKVRAIMNAFFLLSLHIAPYLDVPN